MISSVSLGSLATSTALPASAIGFTESPKTAALFGASLWSRQAHIGLPNTYRAAGNVGTELSPTSFVFQADMFDMQAPHSTVSMLSGG